jgi:hypothetical protein
MDEESVHGMDEELQSLLADLEQPDPIADATVDANSEDVVVAEPVSGLTVPEPELSDNTTDMAAAEPTDLPLSSDAAPANTEIRAVVDKFDHDYGEVQANLKSDRKKIDTVIDILLARVRANADAETDTMSLVKALGVLADTNGHAVKLLDSRSKLLAATKSVTNANQTNINITGVDAELQRILDQPSDPLMEDNG